MGPVPGLGLMQTHAVAVAVVFAAAAVLVAVVAVVDVAVVAVVAAATVEDASLVVSVEGSLRPHTSGPRVQLVF